MEIKLKQVMAQYIDKSALAAELEKRMQELRPTNTHQMQVGEKIDRDVLMWLNALTWVKKILDTLEVKEVDLEKYYIDFLQREWFGKPGSRTISEMTAFTAKHFFELGLQARTDKELVEVKIGETKIYLEDDGGEPPYDGKQWLDFSCTEYEIPKTLFKDGDNVEIFIRKAQK